MKVIAATLVAAVGAARIEQRVSEHALHEGKQAAVDTVEEENYEWDGDESPFEEWSATLNAPDCPSRIVRSTCSDDEFKGIVVFYHGYSACSEQADSVSGMLSSNCFDVLAPTMPGHGVRFVWCGQGGRDDCDVVHHNGNGWTHEELPTDKRDYDNFAYYANRATQRELRYRATATGKSRSDLELNLLGLSFGAPVAMNMAMRGGYTRQLLVNPYLALGDETIDQAAHECEALVPSGERTQEDCERETVNTLLGQVSLTGDSAFARLFFGDETEDVTRKVFTTMARLSDAVGGSYQGRQEDAEGTIASVMETEHEWGSVCNQIFSEGRGGFCKFRTKHYLATHSFGLHAVLDAQGLNAWGLGARNLPKTQIMTTERDGRTRNGLTYDVARHLYSIWPEGTSMCMHKFQHGIDRDDAGAYWNDENSMPHANLKGTRQGGRWWEAHLFDNVRKFLTGEEDSINEPVQTPHSRNICEAVDLGRRAHRDPEVLELVHVGIAPTWSSELWPGAVFGVLGLTSR